MSKVASSIHCALPSPLHDGLPSTTKYPPSHLKPEWLSIPGMYGGFAYQLFKEGDTYRLHTESWNRIIGGSEQTHDITAQGTTFSGWLQS